jgi:hypothetical protein
MKKVLSYPIALLASALTCSAQMSQYSHGNPTADEQYMLELINHARAAPAEEGRFLAGQKNADIRSAFSFYNVNLTRLKQDFAGYGVSPPLTFHPGLLAAARRHSVDMAKKNFQSHTGSDGSTPGSRVNDAGYGFTSTNENIFSSLVPTTLYGHVGVTVDWGPYPNGVQPELIHRKTIMGVGGFDFREIGIGIVARTGESAKKNGKLSITQDFANRQNSPVFLLGVAYSDANLNGIYDPGEGLSGVKVTPTMGSWYATTSTSGGYAIPFSPAAGAGRVTFSGGGLTTPVSRNFTIANVNVKVDVRLASSLPLVRLQKVDSVARESGPASGRSAVFRIVRVGSTKENLRVEIGRSIRSGRGKASPKDYKITAVRPARVGIPAANADRFPVVIPAGRSYADVKVTAVSDKAVEPKELVAFSVLSAKNYQRSEPTSLKISITK